MSLGFPSTRVDTLDPQDRGRVAELLGRWPNSLPATDPSPSLAEAAEAW